MMKRLIGKISLLGLSLIVLFQNFCYATGSTIAGGMLANSRKMMKDATTTAADSYKPNYVWPIVIGVVVVVAIVVAVIVIVKKKKKKEDNKKEGE